MPGDTSRWSHAPVNRVVPYHWLATGWGAAVLEEQYKEHSVGWDTHFASLRDYLRQLVAAQ